MPSGDSGRTITRLSPESSSPTSALVVGPPLAEIEGESSSPIAPQWVADPSASSRNWPPTVARAVDSLRTTVSDSILTPISPNETRSFGLGAYVESPTTGYLPPRFMASPATKEPPAWPGGTALPEQPPSAGSNSTGFSSRTESGLRSATSPRQRPGVLDLKSSRQEQEMIDLTEPPPHTAMSTSSMNSTFSNELLDLSNLRRSMQQNLRERPLHDGDASFDLESINESGSVPSSPYDDGRSISVNTTLALFRSSSQYLVVDTRVLEEFGLAHIERSANVSIPTLLLNRLRKQTTRAGVAGWVSLTRYVSTTAGQTLWDGVDLSKSLDLIIIGVDGDDVDAPYTLADILEPLVTKGMVRVLDGGWAALANPAQAAGFVVKDAPLILNPDLVVITSSPEAANRLRPAGHASLLVSPATAAPAPSQTNVPAISPLVTANQGARNLPNLSITPTAVTTAPRRPPKLQLHMDTAPLKPVPSGGLTAPIGGAQRTNRPKLGGLTIDVGSSRVPGGPQSAIPCTSQSSSTPRMGGLTVNTVMQGAKTSTLAPPGEPWGGNLTPIAPTANFSNIPPPTPSMPSHSSGPLARKQPAIEISTILPSFLYLGPEITTKSDVEELTALGVRRILNVAIECDDDEGLGLRDVFEKYYRIPMKDSVDESGVSKGIRDACKILDDARLHSAPVYVHCKAGRSRSVTVVLAYLIHANAWTLHTSYQYVAERRHGISPNIGFVAELMEFETAELGMKQPGRGRDEDESNDGHGDEEPPLIPREPRIGPRYTRESLPPEFGSERLVHDEDSDSSPIEEPSSIGEHAPENHRNRRKPQPDIEVRKNGQWVLRRTPVDRVTLQPGRRVSKAGLESMIMRPLRRPDEA